MQIRNPIELTIKEYLEQRAWEQADLEHCPFHPEGGCGLAKHGFYPRKFPEYCLVARWYCPGAHRTISLLPDFFASRVSGTLDEVEQVVNTAESCKSQEQAAEVLRPDISLIAGLRWLRRRIGYVREALTLMVGLLVTECAPVLAAFRKKYATDGVLTRLRDIARAHLPSLPPIIGFGPRCRTRYCHSVSSNN
jgi:hypothetical protein